MTAISTGFQESNQNYNLPVFLELATLSAAAYSTGDFLYQSTSRIGWKVFGEKSVNSIALESHVIAVEKQTGNKKEMAISFEGTGSGTDIVTDLTTWGFSLYYKSLRTTIESWVRKGIAENYDHIYFTGHSLGGAAVQIAMLDLLEDSGKAIWTLIKGSPSPINPLNANDRSSLTAEEKLWLRNHVSGATFGAPSISVDPPSLLSEDYIINNDFNLENYRAILFQFEHKKAGSIGDPVAAIGSTNTNRGNELGTFVAIDLASLPDQRYNQLDNNSSLYLHAKFAYVESIARAITGNTLTIPETDSTYQGSYPQLHLSSLGTGNNETIQASQINATTAGAGNDIIVVNVATPKPIDGGMGSDAFVIRTAGSTTTIRSSVSENLDSLFFTGTFGTMIATPEQDTDNLIIEYRENQETKTLVTVENWFSNTSNYQLGGIYRIIQSEKFYWNYKLFTNQELGIPLFKNGASTNDNVIGSNFGSEIVFGGAGRDTINGRGGDDLIYGDQISTESSIADGSDNIDGGQGNDTILGGGGNDSINGNEGADIISGGDGDDVIDGGTGYDVIYGGDGADEMTASDSGDLLYGQQGNDVYAINAKSNMSQEFSIEDTEGIDSINITNSAADYSHTLYAARSSGNLDIYLRNSLDEILTRIQIVGMNVTGKQIENIVISNGGDLRGTASLVNIWNMASVRDANGNPVPFTVSYNGVDSDRRYGTENADSLVGTAGNDSISGYGGNDTLRGMAGNDRIWGGAGDDEIWGGAGADTILGGDGNDTISIGFESGNNTEIVDGGAGIDSITIDASSAPFSTDLTAYAVDETGGKVWVNYGSSFELVAQVAKSNAFYITAYYLSNQGMLVQNVENIAGITGSNINSDDPRYGNDLLIAKSTIGGRYLGGTQQYY
jgi:Ca2+-binding RTX toxin-like protein